MIPTLAVAAAMPCCGGCCSSQASDPEVPRCEVNLEEAGEYSLKLGVRLPRYGFLPPSQWRRGQEIQLSVLTLGGPDCDIKGPKKDLISCRCGGKVVHQVNELLPDTRYTVEVSIVDDALPLKSASSSLEVRTAPARTCQFAEEDWGQGFKKTEGAEDAKKGEKERSAPSRITSARSETERGRSHAGPSMTPQQPAVPRSVSGADDSTIAPSDVDGADLQERNEEWDFSAEEICRERVVEDDAVEEIMPVTGRGIQCNFCSFMDCFRLMRQASQPESNEMLFVGHEVATEAVSIAANLPNETRQPREPLRPRRQRPPFPGVPVDPASVGLELLPVLNESQLQHVFETRTRATRAAEN